MGTRGTRRSVIRWWPFVLLILLGASRWMLSGAWPQTESSVGSRAAGCAGAVVVCVVLAKLSQGTKLARRQMWPAALGGALLLSGPSTAELLHATSVEPGGMMMALALTPVVAALAGRRQDVAGRIWPGLAAVAGLMLVLVQPSLSDARSDVALALAPVLTGCGAALLASERSRSAWRTPCALAGAAIVLGLSWGASAWLAGGVELPSLVAATYDGAFALLSLMVLGRLGAVRWSAQFALLPLLILLQGLLILRSKLTLREALGLLLVAVAGVYLLLPQTEDGELAVVPR